jgi:hypothetical protein
MLHDSSQSWIFNYIRSEEIASCCDGREGEGRIENREITQELRSESLWLWYDIASPYLLSEEEDRISLRNVF